MKYINMSKMLTSITTSDDAKFSIMKPSVGNLRKIVKGENGSMERDALKRKLKEGFTKEEREKYEDDKDLFHVSRLLKDEINAGIREEKRRDRRWIM